MPNDPPREPEERALVAPAPEELALAAPLTRSALAVELGARVVAVVALGWFTAHAWMRLRASPDAFVVLVAIDHTLNVLFLLAARLPREVDRRLPVLAITVAVTMYGPFIDLEAGTSLLPRIWLLIPLFGGLLFEIAAKLTLGRSFGLVPANRGLVRRGPYRLVRHPIYAGYLVLQASFILSHASLRNGALYAVLVALVVVRITLEERVLARDPGWSEYAARTRARLVPFVW